MSDRTLEALFEDNDNDTTVVERKSEYDELLEAKHGLIAAMSKVSILEQNLKKSEENTTALQNELEKNNEALRNYIGKLNELEEEKLILACKAQKASVWAIKYQSEAEKLKKEGPSDEVKKRNLDLFEALRTETKKNHNLEEKIKRFNLKLAKMEETENKLKKALTDIGELVAAKASAEAQLARTTELCQNYKEAFEKSQVDGGGGGRELGQYGNKREYRNNECREFASSGYCRRMECRFQHPENPESLMTDDCQWWLRGNCRDFPKCLRGKHDQSKYNSDRGSRMQQRMNPNQLNQTQNQQPIQFKQNLQQMNQNLQQMNQNIQQSSANQTQNQQPMQYKQNLQQMNQNLQQMNQNIHQSTANQTQNQQPMQFKQNLQQMNQNIQQSSSNQTQNQQPLQFKQNLQQMNQNLQQMNQNIQQSSANQNSQIQQHQPVPMMMQPQAFFGLSPVDREAPAGIMNNASHVTGNSKISSTVAGGGEGMSASATTMAGKGPASFQPAGRVNQQSWNVPQNMIRSNQMMMNQNSEMNQIQDMNQQAQMLNLQNSQQPIFMMLPQSNWPQNQGPDKTV